MTGGSGAEGAGIQWGSKKNDATEYILIFMTLIGLFYNISIKIKDIFKIKN